MLVSDGALQYLQHKTMPLVEETLVVPHHFAVANTPWAHGTVERVNLEGIRMVRDVLNEQYRILSE